MLCDENKEHKISFDKRVKACVNAEGKFSLSFDRIFPFLQKYSLSCLSSGKFPFFFVLNASPAFLSSGNKTSIFPTFFLCSKQELK